MNTQPIYTRSDLDGLLGCAILKEAGYGGEIEFINPIDVLGGSSLSPGKGVRINLPGIGKNRWDRNCWADETPENKPVTACAGILKDLEDPILSERYADWLEDLERWQTHGLTPADFSAPSPVLVMAALCDPATGLGRYRDFIVSNYFFLLDLVDQLRYQTADVLIHMGDVQDRLDLLASRRFSHEEQIRRTLKGQGPLLIQDLREEYRIEPGNPMMKHALAPPHLAILTLFWDKNHRKVSAALSGALNQTPPVHLGSLLKAYGGGGDYWSGITQVLPELVPALIDGVRDGLEGSATAD